MMEEKNREYISEEVLNSGSDFLVHHGVIGMKWGIRRDGRSRGRQGGTSNKKAGSNTKEQKQGIKDLVKTIKSNRYTIITTPRKVPADFGTGHPKLAKIGSEILFEDKMKRDSKIKKIDNRIEKLKAGPKTDKLKYLKDYKSALDEKDKIHKEYVNKSIDKLKSVKNKDLIEKEDKQFKKFTKRKLINDYIDWADFYGNEIEHVESKIDRLETKATMEHSRKDFVEMDNNEDLMIHSIDVGNDFLMHYGVKGMKWNKHKKISNPVIEGLGLGARVKADWESAPLKWTAKDTAANNRGAAIRKRYETRDAAVKTAINSGLKGATKTAINKTRSDSTKKISSATLKGMGTRHPSRSAQLVGRNAVVRGLSKNPKARANYLKAERTRINHRQAKASLQLAKGYAKINKFFKIKPNAKNKKAANKNWSKNRDMFYESL